MASDKKSNERFSWASEIPTQEDAVAQVYDDFAADYEQTTNEWGYEAPTVAAQLLQTYRVAADEPLLDAGCGTGLTGVTWKQAGYTSITGIDISADSLTKAAKTDAYTATLSHNLNDPLPFDNDTFAAVLCIGVLTYVPNLSQVLAEFARVCRNNGLVVFTQRDDLYRDRNCATLFAKLESAGMWKRLYQSEPRPYLPHHPDYGDKIHTYYFVYRILS